MEKSFELIRHVIADRLLKCSLMVGKLFQGAKTCSEKELTYTNTAIMQIQFVGLTSCVNSAKSWLK